MKYNKEPPSDLYKRIMPPQFIVNAIKRLNAAGFEAYIVGGAVRDAYLHRHISDWDVATSASFERINRIFSDIRRYNLKNETVILVDSGYEYEVSTFRCRDSSSQSLEEDLMHRDFTLNAMSYDIIEKKLFDPQDGRTDIGNRIVKAVGDPEERFIEDPLRLFRAVRISVELGFRIEKETMGKIIEMSEYLNSVANERIRDEMMKVLMAPKPSKGYNLLKKK